MGKKDLWQCDYFDNMDRFADMFNGFMFKGEQVIRAEELEEVDSGLIHHLENKEAVKPDAKERKIYTGCDIGTISWKRKNLGRSQIII